MNSHIKFIKQLLIHQDGIVVGATISALKRIGIYKVLFSNPVLTIKDIQKKFPVNISYFYVAMRCLVAQGWLTSKGKVGSKAVEFQLTYSGRLVSCLLERYEELTNFLYLNTSKEGQLELAEVSIVNALAGFINLARNHWGLPYENFSEKQKKILDIALYHLDGLLVAPILITLKMKDILDENILRSSDPSILIILKLFEKLGWVAERNSNIEFTEVSNLIFKYALHYGLTYSYLPTYACLEKLLFYESSIRTHLVPGSHETHVLRKLNVLASSAAHKNYFQDTFQMFIDIFNKEPIKEQPLFIAEMGCGDGTWLVNIYKVISTLTMRRNFLKERPLLMIGLDYNLEAQNVARQKLKAANIPHMILFGDVRHPEKLKDLLQSEHNIDIKDGLHIRAFIDHNRTYSSPENPGLFNHSSFLSTGVFIDESNQLIPNNYLELNFLEHFKKWLPFIEKHGLILLEAHNINPRIVHKYLGKTHAVAFDTYHGYSHQYPIDYKAFMQLIKKVGLITDTKYHKIYPRNLPFIAISLNYLKARNYHVGN
ncbi:MAG: hypothetical protein IBJ00_00685 [Alphaproteobacteria bacterium]|nr:hypothetical protein [Alphaproteobacteria bacterium]